MLPRCGHPPAYCEPACVQRRNGGTHVDDTQLEWLWRPDLASAGTHERQHLEHAFAKYVRRQAAVPLFLQSAVSRPIESSRRLRAQPSKCRRQSTLGLKLGDAQQRAWPFGSCA
eukprot:scaffold244126_cov30-Tisochrysis_lutea.AAC.8